VDNLILEKKDSCLSVVSADDKMSFSRQEHEANTASNSTFAQRESEKTSPSLAEIQLKLNETLSRRDSAILNLIQRVARFANEGKNTARGIEEAWKSADTNVSREKVKRRCAIKCRDLWNQLEKQKVQVTCFRQQNAHYMGKVSMNSITVKPTRSAKAFSVRLNINTIKEENEDAEDDINVSSSTIEKEEGGEECGGDINLIEQKSSDMQDFNPDLSGSLSFEQQQEWLAQGTNEFETSENSLNDEMPTENAENIFRRPSTTGSLERRRPSTAESLELRRAFTSESLESQRPSTTEAQIGSRSDRLYFAGQMGESQNSLTRVKSVSASDKARAFHFTKIDFALAVVECDAALLDIELMQSLILTAETAIKGSAPARSPILQRVPSAKKIASRFNLFSSQASMKMKALKRAVAQVDKHRGQRVIPTQ